MYTDLAPERMDRMMETTEMTVKELNRLAETNREGFEMATSELDRRAKVCTTLTYGVNGFCSFCGLPASCHEY